MPFDSHTHWREGFQYSSYLAFANMSRILGLNNTADEYEALAADLASNFTTQFLDWTTGSFSSARYIICQSSFSVDVEHVFKRSALRQTSMHIDRIISSLSSI
jgi:hypothetical protein